MGNPMGRRVEDYLDDGAKKAWAEGRWSGKVRVDRLMAFFQTMDEDELATIDTIEWFIQEGGQLRVENFIDAEAKQAWSEGKWKGKVTIPVLINFLVAFKKRNGREASVADIDNYLDVRKWNRENAKSLLDEHPDPECGPKQCENLTHPGEVKPEQPLVAKVLTKGEDGKLCRKLHRDGQTEIETGQHMVTEIDKDVQIMFYCMDCRTNTNERRRKQGLLPIRWHSFAEAKRVAENKVERTQKTTAARSLEDGAAIRPPRRSDRDRQWNSTNGGRGPTRG